VFADKDLSDLLAVSSVEPVLSVYLNTDPTAGNADYYKLRLRNMLKRIDLPADVQAITHYFNDEFNWVGRGVAVFSCAPQKMFKTFSLAIPVNDLTAVGNRPVVKPLIDLLDDYGGYGVVLVDKQGARLFYFHLGELREQEGVMGEVVKHVKRGGASTFPGRMGGVAGRTRHAEELVDRNIKDIAEFAAHFFEQNNVRRVIIGGTDETVNQFQNALPKFWQALVVGTFAMGMTASQSEVLAKAMQIGHEKQIVHERKKVNELITQAAKGANASVGLEKVLQDVHQGKVQTLIMNEKLHSEGHTCPSCGWITSLQRNTCKTCGTKMDKVADIVDTAVGIVWRQGGSVVVTQENEILEKAGNIGAMLRY